MAVLTVVRLGVLGGLMVVLMAAGMGGWLVVWMVGERAVKWVELDNDCEQNRDVFISDVINYN